MYSVFIYKEYALLITIIMALLCIIFETDIILHSDFFFCIEGWERNPIVALFPWLFVFCRVQKDVVESLQMQNPLLLKSSFNRPNIYYEGHFCLPCDSQLWINSAISLTLHVLFVMICMLVMARHHCNVSHVMWLAINTHY